MGIKDLTNAFNRLSTSIDVIRPAIDERIQNDNTLGSQKAVLQKIDDDLLTVRDQIISILTVWNITDAKNQENQEVLADGLNRLTDAATLMGGAEVYIREPSGIKDVLKHSSERNAKIAIYSLTDQERQKWRDWLNRENVNNDKTNSVDS